MKNLTLIFVGLCIALTARLTAQSVSPSKTVYASNEPITIHFSGFQGTPKDWISLAAKGLPEAQYTIWTYTNGASSGSVTFPTGYWQYGEYEVRGYFDNGSNVKARAPITIGNADQNITAKTNKPVYKPYEEITVTFSGLPGADKDWIGLAVSGSSDEKYYHWSFTDRKQSGKLTFPGLPEGNYEVRSYFSNESSVRSRHPFVVSNTAIDASQFCRNELSLFFQGMTGLGLAWGRTTCEPTRMSPGGVTDIQNTLRNAIDGLNGLRSCYQFDTREIQDLISRMPSLTNTQAENEIHMLIRKLQDVIGRSIATCDNRVTLTSLFVTGVHVGAAQAHATCQVCGAVPMPMALQTVIRNHLNTARDAYANFLPCTPNVSLSQFDAIPLNSLNSLEAHSTIIGLQSNLVWNISLSECCCDCR